MNLTNMSASEMAGIDFDCSCGRHHSVGIKKILLGSGVISKTSRVIKELGAHKVFLIFDINTYAVAGKKVVSLLEAEGIAFHSHTYGDHLVPDEACVGAALMDIEEDDDMIVAVGSGTINDTGRLLSTRLHIPYLIVCTAPSMDGYASTVSPMIIGENKITLPGVYPSAIIADTNILKNAPMEMLQSGYGDIIGKFTALADWSLAKNINGEYYCAESVALMRKALKNCTDNASMLQLRDETAVKYITEGLILAGVAMGLVGNSRPASGAEHHFAHYWEIALLRAHKPHPLHGNCVGASTVVSASIYEFFPELSAITPSRLEIEKFLHLSGCAANPAELGISRELFHDSVLHAMEIRERYTILRYADKKRLLTKYADILTGRYYD